jgi:hypothetical protein
MNPFDSVQLAPETARPECYVCGDPACERRQGVCLCVPCDAGHTDAELSELIATYGR